MSKTIPRRFTIPKKISLDYLVKNALEGFSSCGDIYQMVLPIPQKIFCLRNPNHIKAVATHKACGVVKPPGLIPKADHFMGNGVFNDLGDTGTWQSKRREINPAFTDMNSSLLLECLPVIFKRYKQRWSEFGDKPVELYTELQRLVLDLSAQTLFSHQLTEEELDWIVPETMFTEAMFTTLTPLWIPTPSNIKLLKIRKKYHALMDRIIRERRLKKKDSTDLLHFLLKSKDPKELGIGDEEIKATMFSVYFGASAVTLTILWSIYFLSIKPELLLKVRTEIDKVLGNNQIDTKNLESLPYLCNVINEALRFYPSFWGSMRYSKEPIEIDGYSFPKNSIFVMVRLAAQRHTDFWTDPEEFIPARFEQKLENPHAFLPFGLGARLCPGRALAMQIAPFVVGAMAQHFDVEMLSPSLSIKFGFGIYPAHDMLCRIKQR